MATSTTTNSFYLTIPSDLSYAGNSLNRFRVKLAHSIELQGNWQVALAELIYPVSHYTLSGGNFYMQTFPSLSAPLYKKKNEKRREYFKKNYIAKVNVPNNHYTDISELLRAVNDSYRGYWERRKQYIEKSNLVEKEVVLYNKFRTRIASGQDSVKFDYDPLTKRVTISVKDEVSFIQMDPKLTYALGFTESTISTGKSVAKYPPDVRVGIKSLYVYLDIIEHQMVGGVKTPLLRIVPITGSYGDDTVMNYTNLHYCNVLTKQFDSLEISINDQTGNPMPFSFGSIVVKLHFKRSGLV